MTLHGDRYICLKLADKSYYDLYLQGEKGEKTLTVTPARKGQSKNELSLYDCSRGDGILLRDILLENKGDMVLVFSLTRNYLTYRVETGEGLIVTQGLIELDADALDGRHTPGDGEDNAPRSREKRKPVKPVLIALSVIFSALLILAVGFFLARRMSRLSPPGLQTSEMTPR